VHTVCALLDECARDADGKLRRELITYVTDRPGHDRRYAIDARKIERELGWRRPRPSTTGIRKTVRWYLDHAEWVAQCAERRYREWVDQLQNYEGRKAMKILLLGKNGQVGWELQRSAGAAGRGDRARLRQPRGRAADFSDPESLAATCAAWRRTSSSMPPPIPRSTRPRASPSWPERSTPGARRAGARGRATRRLAGALQHRLRVRRQRQQAVARRPTRPARSASTARPSSKASRRSRERLPPPHPAHQLGLCRARRQLRQDHAAPGQGARQLTVIDDQIGAPTGADLLADVTAHACAQRAGAPELAGTVPRSWRAAKPAGMATRAT
jgi:hypothetical protein